MTTRSEYQHDAAQWEYILECWTVAREEKHTCVYGRLGNFYSMSDMFEFGSWQNQTQRRRMTVQWITQKDDKFSIIHNCRRLAADCRRLAEEGLMYCPECALSFNANSDYCRNCGLLIRFRPISEIDVVSLQQDYSRLRVQALKAIAWLKLNDIDLIPDIITILKKGL